MVDLLLKKKTHQKLRKREMFYRQESRLRNVMRLASEQKCK